MAVMQSAASSPPTLRRDPERRLIAGVCAGLARYFGIDPLWVRIAFVAASAAGGFGIVVYVLAWALLSAVAGVTQRRLPWSDT
jgi:phage shock protein PspC (stress-responsive transcriptional regulator)